MFSTSTAPVITLANARPMTVTIDGSAARRMWPNDDRAARQALRAGGADVVLVHHLEHGRARVAREQAHVRSREDDRGQQQVLERVPERRPLTGQQRVHRVHAGDVWRRRRRSATAASRPGRFRACRRRGRARSAPARRSGPRRRSATGSASTKSVIPSRRRAASRPKPTPKTSAITIETIASSAVAGIAWPRSLDDRVAGLLARCRGRRAAGARSRARAGPGTACRARSGVERVISDWRRVLAEVRQRRVAGHHVRQHERRPRRCRSRAARAPTSLRAHEADEARGMAAAAAIPGSPWSAVATWCQPQPR